MNNLLKKTQIQLSEELMRRGWWDEAKKALDGPDISPSNRMLQECSLLARKECIDWLNLRVGFETSNRDLLREFDRYTVYWVLNEYRGKDAQTWQLKNERANVQMD